MKALRYLFVLPMATLLAALPEASAQWDDLYYNPATDEAIVYGDRFEQEENVDWRNQLDDGQAVQEKYYAESRQEDDGSEYYYEYYYSSRIRRFHRPFYGFGFYDPCYVDAAFYDPFYAPGVSIYIYNDYDYWRWRSWRRWNRWHGWHHPWWGHGGGWYANNFFINNYYYGVYGYNYYDPYWTTGGWYGTNYGSGWWYNDLGSGSSHTYYGARRTGMTKTPRQPVRDFNSMPEQDEPPVDATPRFSETREKLQPGNADGSLTPTVRKKADPGRTPATTRSHTQPTDAPAPKGRGSVQPQNDVPSAVPPSRSRREARVRTRRGSVPPAHEPATRTRRNAPTTTSPATRARRSSPAASPSRSNSHRARGNYRSSQSTRSHGNYHSRSRYNSPSRGSSPNFNTRSTNSPRSSYRSSGTSRTRSHSPRGRGN